MKATLLEVLVARLRPEGWWGAMAALAGLTALGAYMLMLKPSLVHYRELGASVATDASAIEERVATHAAAVTALQGELGGLQGRLYGSSAALPPEQMESFIIDRLDALSLAHRVQLTGVTPGEVGRVLMFDELPYDVAVRGDYFAIHDWLHAVEHELRPMVVKSFEMQGSSRDESVALKLRLVSYRPREGDA